VLALKLSNKVGPRQFIVVCPALKARCRVFAKDQAGSVIDALIARQSLEARALPLPWL